MDIAAHTRALLEQGFTVFEDAYTPAWVAAMRADIESIYAEFGRPVPYDPDGNALGGDVFTCAAGFAVRSLLAHRPSWAPSLLHPDIVASIRAAIGHDMVLEIAGSVASNSTRPAFRWHTHVDGVDDGEHRRRGAWPEVPDARRVMALIYLQDLDDETGPVLIHPRRVGDPVGPPEDPDIDPDTEAWAGQIELRPRAGSVVAIEQCTWHAVRRSRGDDLRIFVGTTFAARTTAPAPWVETRLEEFAGDDQLLRSLIR